MFFNNYIVFVYIAIFVIVYNLVKRFVKIRLIKNILILFASLLVLLFVVREHSLIVIGIISLLIFTVGRFLQKRDSKALLGTTLTIVLLLFCIRNYPYIQELFSKSFLSFIGGPILSVQKVGISYILFRFVHWLIESYRRTIHKSDFATFLSYIFFFPNFLAGPIDKYNNFHYWVGNTNLKYHKSLFFAGIARIFIGAVKTLGIVPHIINYATDYTMLIPQFSPLVALSLSLLLYSAYIYLDFSGYSDIAIGTAYLIGVKTPENFNNPYFSSNLSVFWKRWHITFSMFLFEYVFKPVIQVVNKIFSSNPRIVNSILGYMVTFVICGLWHGETINFVYWGLWHGVGLSINKLWREKMSLTTAFKGHWAYKQGSVLLTFLYVSIGWVFFHYSQDKLIEIFNQIIS